jgi:hypothetical protein
MTLNNAINRAKKMAMKYSKVFHIFEEDGEFFSCSDAMVDELWLEAIPVLTILEDGKQEIV